jgi:hypothetical protein
MDDLVKRAEFQLTTTGLVSQNVAKELLERVIDYHSTLDYITSLPEPFPKMIAQRTLDTYDV